MMYGMCLSLKNEIVHIAPKGRVNVVAPGAYPEPRSAAKAAGRPDADTLAPSMYRLGEDSHGREVAREPRHRVPGTGNVSARASCTRPRSRTDRGSSFTLSGRGHRTPLKKVAVPDDVAGQIVVLSSPTLAGHMSGHTIMVEGGMEGRLLNTRQDIGL